MKYCHRCPHNGKNDPACLNCRFPERFKYWTSTTDERHDLLEEKLQAPVPADEQPIVDGLDYEKEEQLRKFLSELFSLPPNQLLMLQAVMNKKTFNDFAAEMEKLAKKNETFTRFRAFQVHKALLKNFPFAAGLPVAGQRKPNKA